MTLAEDVGALSWYHTIDLPGGVVTPGMFDTRASLAGLPMPASLEGKRCLDVGTCDGFWAFEMERRGAAEVVGIDLDDPAKRDFPEVVMPIAAGDTRAMSTFGVASSALESKVDRQLMTVYELTPERVGSFDFVFVGSILYHLRDPVRALAAARTVCRGEILVFDVISLALTRLFPRRPVAFLEGWRDPRWWSPNRAALDRFVHAAGFDIIASGGTVYVPLGGGFPVSPEARSTRSMRERARVRRLRRNGVPQAWVHGRPRTTPLA